MGTLTSSLSRAILMAENALSFDNPGRINTLPERIAAVTAATTRQRHGIASRMPLRLAFTTRERMS